VLDSYTIASHERELTGDKERVRADQHEAGQRAECSVDASCPS
jgi:hypothetical protein